MAGLRFQEAGVAEAAGYGCVACGAALFGSSRSCGACRRKKILKRGIGAFIVAELAMAVFFMVVQPSTHGAAMAVQTAQEAAPLKLPTTSGWLYYDTQDNLVGDVTHHARLISNSPINPSGDKHLAGVASGTLELSASEHYGRVVTISFPHVKPACEANPCEVRAIFDATQPMVFAYTDASSDRSTVLMLKDYDRFAQRLAVAHDLTLVASLGTAHDPILTFDVAGYRRLAMARRAALTQLAAR